MRSYTLPTLLFLLQCASPEVSHNNPAQPKPALPITATPNARLQYQTSVGALAKTRERLRREYQGASAAARPAIIARAKEAVFAALREQIFPAWLGTSWDYSGTTQTPGEGKIACGYFVSTTLRDAGFQVERIKMAQQASENIIRTLSPAPQIWRFRKTGVVPVLEKVRARGDGLYLVGLDNHVGYLSNEAGSVSFCHASYLGSGGVTCESAEEAQALRSNYYVLGELLNDELLLRWLMQEKIATTTGS